MAFKMSQKFPTASLDITKDFHILHSAYVHTFVIPTSKQKHTTGSLTHTHTHMTCNNYKQKATGHVTSLANGHFTGSEAPFVCEILTALNNKKRYNFADIELAVGMPAGFAPTKECFKRSLAGLAKLHKMDAFTKLGEPTIRAACTPHFCCLFCFFYQYLAIFPAVLLYPQQSVPALRYTCGHLPSAVPWISEDRLFKDTVPWVRQP